MIQNVFPVVFSCFALGAFFLDVLLCCAAYLVRLKGVGVSRHYFDVERSAPRKAKIEMWFAAFFTYFPIISMIVLMLFIAYCFVVLRLHDKISTIMVYVQDAIKILLPILIPVLVSISGIQRADQTLFQRDNQFRRYRIWPACIVVLASLSAYALLLVWLQVTEMGQDEEVMISAAMLFALLGATLSSVYVILISLRLFCSNKRLEVAQLRKLGRYRNGEPWELWACQYPDEKTLMSFQKYLIQYLHKQTVPFQARLERCCRTDRAHELRVSFSDAEHMRPVWYRRALFWIWLLLMWPVFGAAAAGFLTSARVPLFYASGNLAVVQAGAFWFLSAAFLLRTEPCRKIAVFNTYGSWGYYFTDGVTHKTVYSFSEREFSLSQSKKWLRAVWSVMTLFRIELIQGDIASCSKFLEELKTAAELLPGPQGEWMEAVYHVCLRLIRDEGREDYNIQTDVTPSSAFALQLCAAIWTDYTRSGAWIMDTGRVNA